MRAKQRSGVTLAELAVGLGLLTVVVVIAALLFRQSFQTQRAEESPARLKEDARVFLHRISRHIRNCERSLDPSYYELLGKEHSSVVMRVVTEKSRRVVGYRLTSEGDIVELSYKDDYKPKAANNEPSKRRIVLRNVKDFKVSIDDLTRPTLVSVKLEVRVSEAKGTPPMTLQTRVNLRHKQ